MNISGKIIDKESYENTIKKIELLNTIKFTELDKFKIGSFLAVSYYEILHNGVRPGYKQKLKNAIRCFINDYTYNFHEIDQDIILLFYSHEHGRREDYVRIMHDMEKMIPSSMSFSGSDSGRRPILNKQSFHNLKLLGMWDRQLSSVEEDEDIRSFLVSKLSLAFRWKSLIDKNIEFVNKIKGLVTIFDAREYENILAQICKSFGIKTATIEHGFFSASYYKDENNFDIGMPFLGFVSDEFWTWGDAVKENAIASGLNKNRVVAVGYPKIIKPIDLKGIEEKCIGVILDGGIDSIDTNKKMLAIASEFAKRMEYTIVLKPHPKDFTNYLEIMGTDQICVKVNYESMDSYASNVSFSICFNSSAYIDLLCLNAQVYRYKDSVKKNIFDFLSDEDSFSDTKTLCSLIQYPRNDFNSQNRKIMIGCIVDSANSYCINANRLFQK